MSATEHAIHPYCDLFPDLPKDELKKLADDIEAHGQHQPIYRYNKQIIDGKNRFRACQLAGITPLFEAWSPTKPQDAENTDREIWDFARSMNLHRRQLTQSQYATIAAFKCNMEAGQNQHSKEVAHSCATSQSDVAEEMGVSRRLVQQAAKVIKDGSEPLIDAMKNGVVTAPDAAKIVDLPKRTQTAAVAKVAAGKSPTVAKAVGMDPQEERNRQILKGAARLRPEREPGDESENDPQAFTIQRSKTIKTGESLLRAFDDLQGMKSRKGIHATAIKAVKELITTAKEW